MTIHTAANGDMLTIALKGRLDTTTAPELEKLVTGIDKSIHRVTFDFSDVEYLSSAGLRVLLICKKQMPGAESVRVVGVNRVVKDVFDATGFSHILQIEEQLEYGGVLPFRDFLLEKTRTSASAAAFAFEGRDYTWDDVEKNASAIATVLKGLGVRKRTHVGICGLNSPNWIFTFFAIQQLGAIAVLLNYSSTPAELAMLSRIGDITHLCYGEMPGMLKDPAYLEQLLREEGASPVEHIPITRDVDFSATPVKYVPTEHVEADDPAIMIFTSGSTSLPKMVLLSAYNIMNSSRCMISRLEMTQADSTCLMLPLFHILGLMAVLVSSMLVGAKITLLPRLKPREILEVLSTQKCTVAHAVPTLMLSLASYPEFSNYDVSSVRAVFLATAAKPSRSGPRYHSAKSESARVFTSKDDMLNRKKHSATANSNPQQGRGHVFPFFLHAKRLVNTEKINMGTENQSDRLSR